MAKTKPDEVTEAPVAPPLTDAEQRARLDALLDEVTAKHKMEGYSLPQLLGEPQPYEPIPGLYFKRPKLGHKLDLMRRYEAMNARTMETPDADRDNAETVGLVLPFAFVTDGNGGFRSPTARELVYEVFDTNEELGEFFVALVTSSRKGDKEADGPNE